VRRCLYSAPVGNDRRRSSDMIFYLYTRFLGGFAFGYLAAAVIDFHTR
jgi:hypothetical protein